MEGDADDRSDAAARLRAVRGVSWTWREGNPIGKSGTDAGVIAQEIETVFPEFVTTDDRGIKRVNYTGLVGVLIEAVKELDERVTALEAERIDSGHQSSSSPDHDRRKDA